jgi:thiamine biosynthesis lipoprotein
MSALARAPRVEHSDTFPCFGSECAVLVAGGLTEGDAIAAVALARRRLLVWHGQFSRFEPASELSLLNLDARETVPVSPLMRRVLEAATDAATFTGGLVDATLGAQIVRAGYARHLDGGGLGLRALLERAPRRAPARPHPDGGWRRIVVGRDSGTVTRPPGTRLDAGGIAKGVFADDLGRLLCGFDAYVVDCAGDIRLGGTESVVRQVHVEDPFGGAEPLHTFELARGAVATSGIGRRSFTGPDGAPAHHLLDPHTGRPAFTGIVQVSALAPTATEAETLSKAALLSGPGAAKRWLRHGGVIVLDDGRVQVLSGRR